MQAGSTKSTRVLILSGVIFLVAILTGGCSQLSNLQPQVRSGWSGSSLPGRMAYRYHTFTGREQASIYASVNQQVDVAYQTVVDEGTLKVQILNQDQEMVWSQSFEKNQAGEYALQALKSQSYQIQVIGEGTSGSFELSWHVEKGT